MARDRAIPVAVIGMSCRLPGEIDSPDRFWDSLLRAEDLVTEVPASRWDVDDHYDAESGVPGRSNCKWGAFLEDVAGFDAEFFGIGDREAVAMDPQHRLLLETSFEAVEHAGLTAETLAGSLTGVFVGLTLNDYLLLAADSDAMQGPYGVTGANFSLASGRIAYALGVNGPAITFDTACSSGLLAIHMACRSLHDGESDMAIAGGANVILDPRRFAGGSAAGMLSPTGRCHSFDVEADGFVSGEGAAVVLLKRLDDAQRDGDRILAVIRGTAANQDGRTETITMPSGNAQIAVYQAALAAAGVAPDGVGMVEAHGPGTPAGDPVEYRSLADVYGKAAPTALASVKTNIGHTQSAAGAVSMVKAVLALQHGVIPQNLHFNRLPDDLTDVDTKLFVPQAETPWPVRGDQPRRAAVSSYGMSGTNVHAIVEQAPEPAVITRDESTTDAAPGSLVFPLSSSSAQELHRTAGRLADWLDARGNDVALPDLAYTLARRRTHRSLRTSVLAGSPSELVAALRNVADREDPHQPAVGRDDRGPVWVFSGQGSQWAAMGAELLSTEPAFAAKVAEIEPLIQQESGFSITEVISASETVTGIDKIQPAIFTMQVALAAAMQSYGVRPGAVIGHSMGESAAAVVAGALSLEDGVRVICRRSRLMCTIAGSGAMASVELPAPEVISELMSRGVNDVVVAVVASPESTVIGGEKDAVRELVAIWEARDVMAREVAVDVASHSPQVDAILDELEDALDDLTPMAPTVPYYSATSFDPREQPQCDAYYWVDNLRHTVRFAAAVQAALEDGYRVFAELAPHPLLNHAVAQTARSLGMPLAALAAMRREQELPHGLREFLADLHSAGAAVDFSVLYPTGRLVDAPLPTWTHSSLFLSRDESRTGSGHAVSVHPLLGQHVRLQEEPERHVWQAEVGTVAHPWLEDHKIHNAPALPGAAYCEMALAAANTVLGANSEVRDIVFEQMLLLDDETPLGGVASVESPGVVKFAVETDQDGERSRRATAVLHAIEEAEPPAQLDLEALVAAHPSRVEGAQIRQWMGKRGIGFGPAFSGLTAASTAEGTGASVLAEIGLPASLRVGQAGYGVHPALLDACFQSVAAHGSVAEIANGGMLLPLGVRQLRAHGSTRNARYCYSRVTEADAHGVEADIDLLDEYGNVLCSVRGLQMGTGASQDSEHDRVLAERLLMIEWQKQDLPEIADANPGAWLLISSSAAAYSAMTSLEDALKAAGAQCSTISWPREADHAANVDLLRRQLATDGFDGVVVIAGPKSDDGDDVPVRGRELVRHLVRIVRELPDVPGEPRLYLVTGSAQTVIDGESANLEQAGLRGLMRVVGTEHPQLRTTQIDLDEATGVEHVAHQLIARSGEDETAWRQAQWYAARLTPTPLRSEERRTADVDLEHDGARLQIRTPGDLDSMELVSFERVAPGPGEIEVRVTNSSLNFADVLIAYGRYPTFDGKLPALGTDFSGIVTAVGPDVKNHEVGDRVGGLSANGCWSTYTTCNANLAVTLPAGLSNEKAAATTTATATAWYGLHDLARIRRGDKVLIHSATGGVGQAAIAIARMVGAEIFATAGSDERRQLLRDMGIKNVYDSRSVAFADQIRRDTDGYGVDIVLNSVWGAGQRAGIELLALGGRFIEIGKRDIYGDSRLGLYPFRRNLAFYGLDLALMASSHPQQVRALLETVYRLTADGTLPQPESTHYPLTEAATAIRIMGGAQHTGKLVLDVPTNGSPRVPVPPEHAQVFRGDGSYIITGGLGGLGLFLAEKMAAAGCGRIVLSSRSQPNAKAQEMISLIQAMGSDITVECGDIAEPGTATRLVESATVTGLPLRGVLHAAAVVEDATLENITDELLNHDWNAKVFGAWNLHEATVKHPLDWFCSFSSAAALVGSPGQGAYAAANSWLDAFTLWRRAQGLPATAIAWGAWAEIGRGSEFAEATETAIAPGEGAYAFEGLLRYDRAYTGYAPLTGTPWFTALAQRSKFAERFRGVRDGGADSSKLLDELQALPIDEWPVRLRRLVSDQVAVILRRSIDPDRPLSEYGLDSLGNLELRTHIKAETGIRVTSADITTIQGLAALLCEKLSSDEPVPAPS